MLLLFTNIFILNTHKALKVYVIPHYKKIIHYEYQCKIVRWRFRIASIIFQYIMKEFIFLLINNFRSGLELPFQIFKQYFVVSGFLTKKVWILPSLQWLVLCLEDEYIPPKHREMLCFPIIITSNKIMTMQTMLLEKLRF